MRKSRATIVLILLFLIASIAVFFIAGSEKDSQELSLYFFSSDSSILVPVETEITVNEDIYLSVANALIKGPAGKKYKSIMKNDITVNSVVNENGNLKIDFSGEYKNESILTSYAVIKSFCRLNDVFRVSVSANGEKITDYISGDEINLEFDDDSAQSITLYFANSTKSALVREYRKISITDTQPIEQYIVSELIKGPKNQNNVKLLAPDTGILSVETTDGTCYVNFKQDFITKNIASFEEQQLIVFSIVNSLTEREDVQNVQLLIDGKKTEHFGEMNISQLFYRRDDMLKN